MIDLITFFSTVLMKSATVLFIIFAVSLMLSVAVTSVANFFSGLIVYVLSVFSSLYVGFGMASPTFGPSNIGAAAQSQWPTAIMLGIALFISSFIFAPIFDKPGNKNKYRAPFKYGLIAFAVAPLIYYALNIVMVVFAGPAVLFASVLTLGAAKRMEKSGIWNITTDNYNKKELRYAALIYARENFAPLFLLIFGVLAWSGFYARVWQQIYQYASTFSGGYLWGFAAGTATVIYTLIIALGFSLVFGAYSYFTARARFSALLRLHQQNQAVQDKTVRGASKAADLQKQLDQQ
jgi:MFS family permease